ncbi:MAG: hypothetical protein A2722_00260 [Candidatus Doudnabacteria bacterium RIFCSPHIGHO2_01_FULL_50_11]|uniref:UDP-N-acetylmuramyl-tripeptide synthetase n=1 Tax=Candidatus Doudnabacteria bacterium RIFCSPHIGHO2_01_FULL_50_11 TaxID=1817828 RepID=A0A1F5PHL3_9BACT|nr:MAG: hypothetical protein A2722_00260 [Candidatus Doudnabacteria bacterium RIFCSPHIGHO2_01_FULL_50_11]HLC44910.1 UDP-N-acetylmuramyl-tripeptide synthetase [Patescibacteria group bacterium]
MVKSLVEQFIPLWALSAYHKALSFLAAKWYRSPSKKLVVIGVTGTNGKSTTVNLIAAILRDTGDRVGFTSTVNYSAGGEVQLNKKKMTMPGRFALQRMLQEMVQNGCRYAIVESSSEGVLQYRHLNIHYDAMVITNIAPEHLERHGGFENYKQAKLEYFRLLERLPNKILQGKKITKSIVVNGNDEYARDFLNFKVDKKIVFGITAVRHGNRSEKILAEQTGSDAQGSRFTIAGIRFESQLSGTFNIENCLAAIAAARTQGVGLETSRRVLQKVAGIPGRLESIKEGQPFSVIVDYAYEPNALKALYETVKSWPRRRVIQVLGGTGGGRDVARRPVLGQMASANADIVIVTTDDPYDDDPRQIMEEVASGAQEVGKIEGEDLFRILDRRQAIKKAINMARRDDLVLITGKGAEQTMATANGRYIPWDDRKVVRQELKSLLQDAGQQKS